MFATYLAAKHIPNPHEVLTAKLPRPAAGTARTWYWLLFNADKPRDLEFQLYLNKKPLIIEETELPVAAPALVIAFTWRHPLFITQTPADDLSLVFSTPHAGNVDTPAVTLFYNDATANH